MIAFGLLSVSWLFVVSLSTLVSCSSSLLLYLSHHMIAYQIIYASNSSTFLKQTP